MTKYNFFLNHFLCSKTQTLNRNLHNEIRLKNKAKILPFVLHQQTNRCSSIITVPVDYTSEDIFIQVTNIDHHSAKKKNKWPSKKEICSDVGKGQKMQNLQIKT